MNPCECGCGAEVQNRFRLGHQSRVNREGRAASLERAHGTKGRNDEIVSRIESGERYESIGVSFGISKQRVEQIARNRSVPPRGSGGLSGPANPRWKGRRVGPGGYMRAWAPDHPRAYDGYVLEHILVAEVAIGRPLATGEIVHHINGVRDDNRPENLQVMTQSEHSTLHNRRCSSALLLDWLRWIALKVHHTPTAKEIDDLLPIRFVVYHQRFGSQTKAAVAAGLNPNGVGGLGHGGTPLPLNFRRQYAHLQQYRTPVALASALHGGIMSEHQRANIENRAAAS